MTAISTEKVTKAANETPARCQSDTNNPSTSEVFNSGTPKTCSKWLSC